MRIARLRARRENADTPPPWRAMRDGNQYLKTRYMPTATLVGSSRIDGPHRPWNPHALLAFGFKPEEYETVRFTDADADFVEAAINHYDALLDIAEAATLYKESVLAKRALVESSTMGTDAYQAAIVDKKTKGEALFALLEKLV